MVDRRARGKLGVALALFSGLLALWVLEVSRLSAPTQTTWLSRQSRDRLAVFLIDSWALRDAEDAALMPRLHARLGRSQALAGPVRTCADAVTVPCLTALLTGIDRFSIFALGRNFGGGVLRNSLFSELQRAHKRIGYIGVPHLRPTFSRLDYVDTPPHGPDTDTIARGAAAMDAQRLDLALIHLYEADHISHRVGAEHAEYRAALGRVDEALDRALDALLPSSQVLVMGDHGHTPDGRHFAGLDVPTYAMYFGSRFARDLDRPMVITDHGAIWARLMGARFGAPSWVDAYFDGGTVSVPDELPPLPSSGRTPAWAWAVCLALALLIAAIAVRPIWAELGGTGALCGGAFLALGALQGAAWFSTRPLLSYRRLAFNMGVVLLTGLVGALLSWPIVRRRQSGLGVRGLARWELGLLGALLLAIPTIYKYGGTFAALSWLGIGLIVLTLRALAAKRYVQAAATAACWLPLYSIYNPSINNFAMRWFPVYSEWLAGFEVASAALWFAAASWLALAGERGTRSDWIGVTAGVLGASLFEGAPAWLFAAPCALSVPLCVLALRSDRFVPLAFASALPGLWFFFEGRVTTLAALSAVLLLFAALPRVLAPELRLARGLAVVTLLLASFWVSMGSRVSGVNFDFFFDWLPAGIPVTKTWALQALMSAEKYLLVPLFGLVLAVRSGGRGLLDGLALVDAVVAARLAVLVAFVASFSLASPDAGPFLTADVLQEAAEWIILLSVLLIVPKASNQAQLAAVAHEVADNDQIAAKAA